MTSKNNVNGESMNMQVTDNTVKLIRKFSRTFREKPHLRNGETTLSNHALVTFLTWQIYILMLFAKLNSREKFQIYSICEIHRAKTCVVVCEQQRCKPAYAIAQFGQHIFIHFLESMVAIL